MAAQHFADPSPSRRSVRVSSQTQLHLHNHHYMSNPVKDEIKGKSRVGGQSNSSSKLGTFAGVFVPTSLNVLSILMFLRFGMIIGQSGILGMMGKSTLL